MDVRSLGFRTDVMLLEMGGSVVSHHRTHLVVRTPANPGFWWGNFVLFDGPPGTGDVERWTELFDTEFPGSGHRAFGVDGVNGETASAAQLAHLGVTAEVNAVMTAGELVPSSSLPPLPAGTGLRPLAGDDDWGQALELDIACYGQPDASDDERSFMARRVAAYRALCEAGHGTWSGAFVDGRLRCAAGVFSAGTGLARFQNVETHPAFRRRGLASAVLLTAGEHALRDANTHTLVIVADPEDDAMRLYQALGFAVRNYRPNSREPAEPTPGAAPGQGRPPGSPCPAGGQSTSTSGQRYSSWSFDGPGHLMRVCTSNRVGALVSGPDN